MGRKSRRSVYDPTIENTGVELPATSSGDTSISTQGTPLIPSDNIEKTTTTTTTTTPTSTTIPSDSSGSGGPGLYVDTTTGNGSGGDPLENNLNSGHHSTHSFSYHSDSHHDEPIIIAADVKDVGLDDEEAIDNEVCDEEWSNNPYSTAASHRANYGVNNNDPDEILDPNFHNLDKTNHTANTMGRRALVLLLLGGAVAIMVVGSLSIMRNKANQSSGGGTATSTTTKSSASSLPPIPAALSSFCAAQEIETNIVMKTKCEELCEPAECCSFPSNLELSCLSDNEQLCLSYHTTCGILMAPSSSGTTNDTAVTVTQAPADLDELCSPASLHTNVGIRSCAKFCTPVECCWELNVTSCADDQYCQGYSSCLHLRAVDKIDASIPDQVAQYCADATRGDDLTECQTVCQAATCCFDTNKCPELFDGQFCDQYRGCSILYDNGSMLAELTTTSAEGGVGLATDNFNSVLTNPSSSDDLPPLPLGIEVACDPEFLKTDQSHRQQCQDDCQPADCCDFSSTFADQSCLDTNLQLCYKYQRFCAALNGSLVADPNPNPIVLSSDSSNGDVKANSNNKVDIQAVVDACSVHSLSTMAGYQECEDYCKVADCCWSESTEMHCRDNKLCVDYSSCLNFKALTHVNLAITTAVNEVCTKDRMAVPSGRAICEQMCAQHKCCYDPSTIDVTDAEGNTFSCPFQKENPDICKQYAACGVLVETEVQGFAPLPTFSETLVNQCYNVSNADDQITCSETCKKAECCLLPENLPNSCLKENHEVCNNFHRACSALTYGTDQDETTVVPKANSNLLDLCSVASLATHKGHNRCYRQCQPAECCFSKLLPSGKLPCTRSQEMTCRGYSPCLNLAADSFASDAVVTQVDSSCTTASLNTVEGRAICSAVCMQHTCCWKQQSDATITTDDGDYDDDDDDDKEDDWASQIVDDDDAYDASGAAMADGSVPTCADPTVCAQYDGCAILNNARRRRQMQQQQHRRRTLLQQHR